MRVFFNTLVLLAALLGGSIANAVEPVFSDKSGHAIRGYDPVAYFTESTAQKGQDKYTFEWNGASWRFSSEQNLNAFKTNPEKYAPQYGGYCAWAVSQGYTASVDPDAWYIHNDRLYLNYSKRIQRKWQKDIPGNINQGDANWPGLLAE